MIFTNNTINNINIINKLLHKNDTFYQLQKYLSENSTFSNKINNFINELFNNYNYSKDYTIKNYYSKNKYNNLYLNSNYITKHHLSLKDIKNMESDTILSSKFIKNNKDTILNTINMKYYINISKINITFYCNTSVPYKEINNLIYNILVAYFMILKYFNNSNTLNLTIFYCDIKKMYDNSLYNKVTHNIINYDNMNSGLSYNNNIILFRKQEILKVFIHELLHHINIDNFYYYTQNDKKLLKSLFKIKSEHNYNEGYIEFLAIIFHTLFISFTIEKNLKLSNNIFKILINYEIINSFIQLSKFLLYHNIKLNDFFTSNKYIETTNTFSYIYLKFLLLIYYNNFLNIIIDNKIKPFNETTIYFYLINLIKTKKFIKLNDLIYKINSIILKYCNNFNKNNYFCKNNNLSIFQLNFNNLIK